MHSKCNIKLFTSGSLEQAKKIKGKKSTEEAGKNFNHGEILNLPNSNEVSDLKTRRSLIIGIGIWK